VSATQTRLDAARVATLTWIALFVQVLMAITTATFAGLTGAKSLPLVAAQVGLGALFWLAVALHLQLRQAARLEARDREALERKRIEQGLQSIFESEDLGAAARMWEQWVRKLAPALSLAIALSLLGPLLWVHFFTIDGLSGLLQSSNTAPSASLMGAAFLLIAAFAGLGFGYYLGGLSRVPSYGVLRAGAGVMLTSTIALGLAALSLGLAARGWMLLDRALGPLILVALTLQSAEMLLNLLLDLYRPRIAGVEDRPGFDSRLSGWLAEPRGLLESIGHTLDYQFGFKVSETWFYRFLERALAPLILVQILSFYGLSAMVVVRPGERLIIERFGAPRGVTSLPANDADWDQLPEVQGPGLHLKWPWPFETARIISAESVTTVKLGFGAEDHADAMHKSEAIDAQIITWDRVHVEGEHHYLLPLQQDVGAEAGAKDERRGVDVMMLQVLATIEYKVGSRARGDIYRYAYLHQDPNQTIRALFEGELTSYLAGARFWDLLVEAPAEVEAQLLERVRAAAQRQRLGLELVSLHFEEVHPPVGAVGKAYQSVLAAREARKALIYSGEVQERRIVAASRRDQIQRRLAAEVFGHRQVGLARARAALQDSEAALLRAAPRVYPTREQLEAVARVLRGSRIFVVPKSMELRLDHGQLGDSLDDVMTRSLKGE
jgi:membrane protease subunit HflK